MSEHRYPTMFTRAALATLLLGLGPVMPATAMASDTLSLGVDDTPLTAAELDILTGRFDFPSGVVLMFGLAQTLSVDGVEQVSSAWQMSLGQGQPLPTVSSPLPHSGLGLQNSLDAVRLQQWQTITVELSRMGDPALAGLASRVSRLVIPGLP